MFSTHVQKTDEDSEWEIGNLLVCPELIVDMAAGLAGLLHVMSCPLDRSAIATAGRRVR
jgi:hypothetical protein